MDISILLSQSERIVEHTTLDFQRYLMDRIRWNNRLIGVKGSRGTGKTTLLIQWLKKQELPASKAAYFSLDDLFFSQYTLRDTINRFYLQGGRILVLDEVHKYPNWSQEIKNAYDFYPDLKILFTGSSIIEISKQQGDLSRRALIYVLHGLSFREYLSLVQKIKIPAFPITEVIQGGNAIQRKLPKGFRPLEFFQDYLKLGFYPFAIEDTGVLQMKLTQLIRTIVEYDMAELPDFDVRNAKKMLQLLYVIAQQVPFKPNIASLAEQTSLHRITLNNYLQFLENGHLIHLLQPMGRSTATLQKPEKIYLNNTNLLYALAQETVDKGTLRESFFIQSTAPLHHVQVPKDGDFSLDGKYIFEVGGRTKTKKQIAALQNAFVVRDDIDFSYGTEVPLWQFGLLY